ncbi:Major facilitator superfamily transporter [Cordyceps militaris CM01]|uniref:Major facilitator superfamily transporter n=1 Tax=Cordyceps militaris (strain CM01) TaxID=983644 RepID=G3JRE0_CORMM|nr:Major facilitator superfamily transporter [Cordyceps militaris CM01]EGX88490.1 Major facilitator superfamily transporter [Cordyceps militaris CM01]
MNGSNSAIVAEGGEDSGRPHDGQHGRSSTEINREAEEERLESSLPEEDDLEEDDLAALDQVRSRTRSRPGYETIEWKIDDPENPKNWSHTKKCLVTALTSMLVLNSTIGSALPSQAIPFIADYFGVTSQEQRVLPISIFLVGYVFGPLIWGPLSEHIGRRNLTLVTFTSFTLFTMGCALAPSWRALLVLRFFTGVFAASPIAIVAGILADVYGDARERGRAFGVFMVVTTLGPLVSPIISGYTAETIGWRWAFWVNLMYAGATLACVLFLPETYEPVLLERRARRLRAQDPARNKVVAPRELEETDVGQLISVVLARPLRMLFTEPIVACCCAYLGLVYAVFYMSFQAYPIIYQQLYHLSPGETGLTYLSVGVGAAVALPIFWNWDAVLARAQARGALWVRREEYRRLPLACIGGPLFVISLFWMGWSARPGVSFVVPLLAGIPFGVGMVLIFFAILNYLVDAYEIFAASANAASSTSRSVLAVVLPFATTHMFDRLGIAGACSLLGGLLAVMCVIPFIFIWKGEAIRARSKFCVALRERREKLARRAEERRRRQEREEMREKARNDAQRQRAAESLEV